MGTSKTYTIAALPGDGIGPSVTRAALDVMEALGAACGFRIDVDEHLIGGAALDATGVPFPEDTQAACSTADAVFLGAVGGPAWDDTTGDRRPEAGLLALRKHLGVYANLRPVVVPEALAEASPLRPERVAGTDVVLVRELTGGIYFGTPRDRTEDEAHNTMRYSADEIARIARIAFEQARQRTGRVTSVDKANVLEVSQLWRDVVTEVHRTEAPEIELDHLYVDNAAMQLVQRPTDFDVILTANLFGDILSDLAATFPGSLGLLPSASLGGDVGLFEPVHGSAPDIAGQDLANPIAALLSAAMLLDELGETEAASALRHGVDAALDAGHRTADLARNDETPVSTSEMSAHVASFATEALTSSPTTVGTSP